MCLWKEGVGFVSFCPWEMMKSLISSSIFLKSCFCIMHFYSSTPSVSPWHLSLLYYLSALCLCHVPPVPYRSFFSVRMFHSTKAVLSCVGCFKDTAVAPGSTAIWWHFSGRRMCYFDLWKIWVEKEMKRSGEEREEERREEKRRTFRMTFGDRHCEITAMAFQLSQIIFRNEMTNCKRELQFPSLIIYFN